MMILITKITPDAPSACPMCPLTKPIGRGVVVSGPPQTLRILFPVPWALTSEISDGLSFAFSITSVKSWDKDDELGTNSGACNTAQNLASVGNSVRHLFQEHTRNALGTTVGIGIVIEVFALACRAKETSGS